MPTEPPPDPFRTSAWSTLSSGVSWSQTTTIGGVAYGRFVDVNATPHYLFPEAAGSNPSDGICWTLDTTLPATATEHLMTSGSASVILSGTDATDGTKRTVYGGNNYQLQQVNVSGTMTMKAMVS